jgi:hypothetical protein
MLRDALSIYKNTHIDEHTVLHTLCDHVHITAHNMAIINDITNLQNMSTTGIKIIYIDISLITLCTMIAIMQHFKETEALIIRSSTIIASGQLFIGTVTQFNLKLLLVLVRCYEPENGFLLEWDNALSKMNKPNCLHVFHQDLYMNTDSYDSLIVLNDEIKESYSDSSSDDTASII